MRYITFGLALVATLSNAAFAADLGARQVPTDPEAVVAVVAEPGAIDPAIKIAIAAALAAGIGYGIAEGVGGRRRNNGPFPGFAPISP